MADEKQELARERLAKLGTMSLSDLAVEAALTPGSTHSQVVEIELRRRVAEAEIEAAKAQKDATVFLKRTAGVTVALALATFILAIATIILVLVTFFEEGADEEQRPAPTNAHWLTHK